jgi:hypothetical protein
MAKLPKKTLGAGSLSEWANQLPKCPSVLPDGTILAVESEDQTWTDLDISHEPKTVAAAKIDPSEQPKQLPSPKAKDPGLPVQQTKPQTAADPQKPKIIGEVPIIGGKKAEGVEVEEEPETSVVAGGLKALANKFSSKKSGGDEEEGAASVAAGAAVAQAAKKAKPAQPVKKPEPKKEDAEIDTDSVIGEMIGAVRARGYDVPDDMPIDAFIEAVETDAELGEDEELKEFLDTIKKGYHKVAYRLTRNKMKKMAKKHIPGVGALASKALHHATQAGMSAESVEPTADETPVVEEPENFQHIILNEETGQVEVSEDVHNLIDKMVEVLESAGYEIKDDVELFDFLEGVDALLDEDEELDEDKAAWLEKALDAIAEADGEADEAEEAEEATEPEEAEESAETEESDDSECEDCGEKPEPADVKDTDQYGKEASLKGKGKKKPAKDDEEPEDEPEEKKA